MTSLSGVGLGGDSADYIGAASERLFYDVPDIAGVVEDDAQHGDLDACAAASDRFEDAYIPYREVRFVECHAPADDVTLARFQTDVRNNC